MNLSLGLDTKISAEIYNILEELNKKGITIIMSSHDLNFFKNSSIRIIMLDDGKIVFNDLKEKWQGG
ncbi:MAG: hypothetical protein IJ809_06925 [Clostridia bacterium]|nr:hypothetical protein [Clostridia bacterium]